MADNYLEKRYEEVFGKASSSRPSASRGPGLETLLRRNRSYREYDCGYEVMERQLEAVVRVNTLVASSGNRQHLRFKLVTKRSGAGKMQGLYRLGGALPELHLPFPGREPEAFIIVCSTLPECPNVDIDLGISAQSMLLKAAEMGLQGLMIASFDRAEVKTRFNLPDDPLLLIAVGKGLEKVELVSVDDRSSLKYYRKDGVHFVPKLPLEAILL